MFPKSGFWHKGVDVWLDIAKNLARGKGYVINNGEETAFRVPVYPFYLAFILKLLGIEKGLSFALTMQMVLDTITCWLIWKLALKLFNCHRTALLAAFLWAIYPPAMVLDLMFYSEPLFTLLLCGFSLHMLFLRNSLSRRRFLLGGMLLGLVTLCRPVTLYFPLVLLPVLLWHFRRQFKKILAGTLMFVIGFWLVLSPWVIRNYLVFNKFMPTSIQLGRNMFYSLVRMEKPDYLELDEFHDLHKTKAMIPQRFSSPGEKFTDKDEIEQDRILSQAAWSLIKKYPYRFLMVCLNRITIIWFNMDVRTYSHLRNLGMLLMNLPLVMLFFSVILFRDKIDFVIYPILWLILYNTLAHMLVVGSWRYNIPIMPYVLILSAYALVRFHTEFRSRLSPVPSSRTRTKSLTNKNCKVIYGAP